MKSLGALNAYLKSVRGADASPPFLFEKASLMLHRNLPDLWDHWEALASELALIDADRPDCEARVEYLRNRIDLILRAGYHNSLVRPTTSVVYHELQSAIDDAAHKGDDLMRRYVARKASEILTWLPLHIDPQAVHDLISLRREALTHPVDPKKINRTN